MIECARPSRGWYCKLPAGHFGPCPARPRWWNLNWRWYVVRNWWSR